MTRDLHSDTLAVLNNENLQMFHIVTFFFSVTFRLTDHQHDIDYDFGSGTEIFLSTGRLSSAGNVTETLGSSNQILSLTFTGANEADIALALSENYNDRRVVIRRGFFDASGATTDANIIADPFIIFDGRVDSYTINDDPMAGDSTVTWRIGSHWADWEKVNGRKCTNQSAKQTFPDEEGFSHVYDQIGDKVWGSVRVNTVAPVMLV